MRSVWRLPTGLSVSMASVALVVGCSSSPPRAGAGAATDGDAGDDASLGVVPGGDATNQADGGAPGPTPDDGGNNPSAPPEAAAATEAGTPLGDGASSPLTVTRLRCELSVNPLQVEPVTPRLTWELESSDAMLRSETQTSFEVLVASSLQKLSVDSGDVWSSGATASRAPRPLMVARRSLR